MDILPNNRVRFLISSGWVDIKNEHKFGSFEGRTFVTESEIVPSPIGSGSMVVRRPIRASASFGLKFFFHGEDLLADRVNYIDSIMLQTTAIEVNGYVARAIVKLDDEELMQNNITGMKSLSYTIELLDSYYWSPATYLQEEVKNVKMRRVAPIVYKGKNLNVSDTAKIVVGPSRWQLYITGQPTVIVVQATRVDGALVAYAFSASNIKYGEDFSEVIIDNFSLDIGDMKRFEATKPTGERQNLSRYIDVVGNGFFDLPAGEYEFRVFLAGNYDRWVLRTYSGRLNPPMPS